MVTRLGWTQRDAFQTLRTGRIHRFLMGDQLTQLGVSVVAVPGAGWQAISASSSTRAVATGHLRLVGGWASGGVFWGMAPPRWTIDRPQWRGTPASPRGLRVDGGRRVGWRTLAQSNPIDPPTLGAPGTVPWGDEEDR